MKAFIYKERIRVSPVPKNNDWRLWLWLKKPLTKGNKSIIHADVNAGQKFYSLPCDMENINGVVIKKKEA